MKSSGFDPYDLERYREAQDIRWEQSRPYCDMCGDRIYANELYRVGEYAVCEGCVKDAWDSLSKQITGACMEKLGAHSDWKIMEHLIEFITEIFDLDDFKEEYGEAIENEY